MRPIIHSAILALLFLLPVGLRAADFTAGVWLNRHVMAEGEQAIIEYLDQAKERGINAIFPNYWFHGCVIYPGSAFARQHADFEGWDPMAVVLRESKARGMKVYPWFEYGFFSHFNRDDSQTDLGYLLNERPHLATKNKEGRMGLRNEGLGVTHYSFNPAHPEARRFVVDVALEVMDKYPEMDGLHLDRIRYQGPDWSYDDYSREQFQAAHGVDPMEIADEGKHAAWVRWRELQVNAFMDEIAAEFRRKHPGKPITAAVVPPYMKEEKFQRWEEWARAGALDVAVPMLYGDRPLVQRELNRSLALLHDGIPVWAGIDAAMPAEEVLSAVQLARNMGLEGIVIWDDRAFLSKDISLLPFTRSIEIPADAATSPATRPAPVSTTEEPVTERPELY